MHKKSFHASKFAASDHVQAQLEETQSSWMTAAELNHFSLEQLHKLPPFTLITRELNEIWSFIERKKEDCGAIMRADCEVRMGTASEGMSRLARLVLLQRKGCIECLRGFILELRFYVRVLRFSASREDTDNPLVTVYVQSASLCKSPKKPPIPDSQSLTLEGNRGVRQIKQSYPVASVIACVLW